MLGVEFFVLPDGKLLVNEIAPRVHNSGHWTEAVCITDQFEQHIRAVLGWPLGDPTRLADVVMENLIGDEIGAIPRRARHRHPPACLRQGRVAQGPQDGPHQPRSREKARKISVFGARTVWTSLSIGLYSRTNVTGSAGRRSGPMGQGVFIKQHLTIFEGRLRLQVVVRDNNVDQALRALKKKLQREGVFREMKLRNYYEKPSEKKARQKAEAVRRARKLARKRAQREGGLPAPAAAARPAGHKSRVQIEFRDAALQGGVFASHAPESCLNRCDWSERIRVLSVGGSGYTGTHGVKLDNASTVEGSSP